MSQSKIDSQSLVRLGKGQIAALKPVVCGPWLGAQKPSRPLFSEANVAENKRLYPHLFRD